MLSSNGECATKLRSPSAAAFIEDSKTVAFGNITGKFNTVRSLIGNLHNSSQPHTVTDIVRLAQETYEFKGVIKVDIHGEDVPGKNNVKLNVLDFMGETKTELETYIRYKAMS